MRRTVVCLSALALLVVAGCETKTYEAACAQALVASQPGTVAPSQLNEISGLDASTTADDTLWTHNDSGDSARVFAISESGALLNEFTLPSAPATDWEDLSIGPGPGSGAYLYAADIGDNGSTRSQVTIYRFREPTVTRDGTTQPVAAFDAFFLRYPGGPRDAEAFMVDPLTGAIVIVAKNFPGGGAANVYEAPANLAAGSTTTMTSAGTVALPSGFGEAVTAADAAPFGTVVALRTYSRIRLYTRSSGQTLAQALSNAPCPGPTPFELQGEAIAFTRNGTAIVTIAEGVNPKINRYSTPPTPPTP